jgi:ABC-type transporter MlaC component
MRPGVALVLVLASAGTATDALRERDAEIRAALPPSGDVVSDVERGRIEAIVARIVDTQGMLEAALGTRWAALTEDERQRLHAAFARRFKKLGASELESMREARIEYLPERSQGALAIVPTRVRVRDRINRVNYVMRETAYGWRILDMVIDDVSMADNYKASFTRIIRREGLESLIHRLEGGSENHR